MRRKFMALIICIYIIDFNSLLFTKDLYQFDLRDYGMSWYMKREDVLKLNRKEIKENGTKIILCDDAGNKMEGNIEYDENGELYKILFYLDEVKPKNSEEYRKIKESYLSKYRETINKMEVIYGKKRNSYEISNDDFIYEEEKPFPLISGFEYSTYWIYQYHTFIDVTFDGNDETGFELVLQFISLRHYLDSIDKSHQK